MIEDIHTHNSAAHGAVISVNPWEYSPRQGALYSVGIHPWKLKAVAGPIPDFELLEDIAGRENVVMIGETGIDKLHEPDVEYQITVLKRHIELSEQLGKPLILHCVRASNELCALHKALRPSQPWIIHGFRNNANVARRLLDAGFYLSYGEFLNIDALNATPPDRLLAETDESQWPINDIISHIAQCRNEDARETTAHICANIRSLLKIS